MAFESEFDRTQRLIRNKAIFDEVGLQQARLRLEQARQAQQEIWTDPEPLVTIRILTYNRPEILVERAVASVLNQTYRNFEVLIVGDHAAPETADALARVTDERVRYFNMPERGAYAQFPRFFWSTAGCWASLRSYELCRGEWMNWLDDDDELVPDHIERLMETAYQHRAEMVFGVSEYQEPDGSWRHIGQLTCGQICSGAVMFHRRVFCLLPDPYCWLNDEPGDWNLWRRMAQAGVRIAATPTVVYRHYMERSMVGDEEARRRSALQSPTAQQVFEDLARTGGDHFLQLV